MVTSLYNLSPVARRPSVNMMDTYVEIFWVGILAVCLCILLIFARKKFSSKMIWRSLFLFCLVISLFYSLDMRKGCFDNEPKFINGVCLDTKLFPDSTVPPLFD